MTAGSVSVPQIIPLRYASGQRKNVITSSTKIEIKTETKKCDIFYTLDNNKPDPFKKYGKRYTYKYKVPFTLAPGSVTIKALALSKDRSRQSSVVTKLFVVYEGEEMFGLEDHTKEESELQLDVSLSGQFKQRIRSLSRGASPVNSSSSQQRELAPIRRSSSQIVLTQNENDPVIVPNTAPLSQSSPIFIPPSVIAKLEPRCLYCSYPRDLTSSDSYCTNCGRQLPSLPDGMKEATRMAVCPSCRSEQPPNASSDHCLVCGTRVIQPTQLPLSKNHTETHIDMGSILCLHCGTLNLSHLSNCVTCANSLYNTDNGGTKRQVLNANNTIMHPVTGSTYVMCDNCGRVNVSDARYCDWCGCRPMGSDVQLLCQNCDSTNNWRSRYCSNCGSIMKCPLRPEIEQSNSKMRMPIGVTFDHSKWIPIADVDTPMEDKCILVKTDTRSHSTQTCGQFYPSANTITTKKTSEAWQKLSKTISQDKMLALSLYSTGKGKWRDQVDHICSHLKAHSHTSIEFQDDISNCQIGKVIKSSVEVNNDNNQLILNITYALKDDTAGNNSTVSRYFSTQVTKGMSRTNSVDSSYTRRGSNTLTKKPPLRRGSTITIKVEDHLLCAELGPDGLGRADIVGNLVEKGANVNHIDTVRGLPILLLATASAHLEAIKVLLERGADINIVSKKYGNTALHIAVKLGNNGQAIIKTLLSVGANSNTRNIDNLTPCELATKLGHHNLVQCFASHLGSTMLGMLNKKSVTAKEE